LNSRGKFLLPTFYFPKSCFAKYYIKDQNSNKIVLPKITKPIEKENINKAFKNNEINEIEKSFLLQYSKITNHNRKLYRFLIKKECENLNKEFSAIPEQEKDISTMIIKAAGIVLEDSEKCLEAEKLLDQFLQNHEHQRETIEYAKATLALYCLKKDMPLGYFVRMINLVLKSGIVDNKEPNITDLESSKHNFAARFIYELQPWKLKPYMKVSTKSKPKKTSKQAE